MVNARGKRRGADRPWSRVLVMLCLAAALLGCAAETPREDLRFGLASMPVTLDPRHATDAASARIIRLLYQRLVEFDEHAMPVQGIARWETPEPTLYRFVLQSSRPRFSDGSELTAADVVASYESVLDERTASPHRISLENVAGIQAIDDEVVEFRLKRPDPLFPGRLTIGIMPRALLESDHQFNRSAVGSGPFEFAAWPADGELRLRRRADGAEFVFVAVQDPTVRVLKVLRGEIDMIQNDLPPELVSWLREREEVTVSAGSGTNFAYLGFNLRDPLTGQPELRRAIAHAIDREALIRYVLGDTARPAGGILPPEHWAGLGEQGIRYDPAEAKRLLASVGLNNVRIVYKTSTDPVRLRLATAIQRQLGEIGIEVDLRSYDWGTFYGDIKAGNFQMYSLSWVGVKLPEIYRYAFHSTALPPLGANRGFFVDAFADRLIEQAEAADSAAEQLDPLHALQRRLLETLPYVPLWYEDHVFIARSDIRGYRIAPDGNYDSLATVRRVGWEGRL
jgi:peptide/nickel transport system substrate-binding protein